MGLQKNKTIKFDFQPMEELMKYEVFKAGDRVKHISYGKGIVLDVPGVGYVVKFDDGKTRRITDGMLKRI